ncbi:hypothetical protein AZE42_07519, partial [Rhizopogon vesiculosus]
DTTKGVRKTPIQAKRYAEDSDNSSDDDGSDAHVRTAHILLAGDLMRRCPLKAEDRRVPRRDHVARCRLSALKASVLRKAAYLSYKRRRVPVSEQTTNITPVPAISLSVHHSLPTSVSSPVLRPLVAQRKRKEREIQINAEATELLLPPSSSPAIRSSSPIAVPRITIHSRTHPTPPVVIALDEVGEDSKPPAPALSAMPMSACTSPSPSFEDIDIA